MQETFNYIHQTSYIHSRFTKEFKKISYFDLEALSRSFQMSRAPSVGMIRSTKGALSMQGVNAFILYE